MAAIARILSRPTAKPYRTHELDQDEQPFLNDQGHLDFAPGDVENPKNWTTGRRIWVSISCILLVTNATYASSSPSGCLPSISRDFNVSTEVAGLTVTVFLLGYCFGPLLFAPLSEFYGRRWIFYVTFLLYIAFTFLCAFAPNFAALLIGRFLASTFVSAPLTNAPGVMADLWGPIERSVAMAGFSLFIWAGPALGPVIGGFIQLTKDDWRWTFYVNLMMAGGTAILMFTIPETYAPVILLHKARRIRRRAEEAAAAAPATTTETLTRPSSSSGSSSHSNDVERIDPLTIRAPIETTDRSLSAVYKIALTRPWIILFDTISFLCALYMSVVYLLLYMLFSIYPIIFQQRRGWNAGVGQLPLLGTIVGAAIGALIVLYDARRQARRIKEGKATPEDRLFLAMPAGILFSGSMFWLAWAGQADYVHWIVPTLAGVFLATSMMLIFVAYLNYLVDSYLMYAASAIAANTIVRSAVGAAAPLFTNYMFQRLGVGGGGSLIAGVGALLAIIPFMFYKYGEKIRIRSKFAPTKPPAPEPDEERAEGPARPTAQASRSAGNASEKAQEGSRKKDRDVHQNALGEPRDENARFGKEG